MKSVRRQALLAAAFAALTLQLPAGSALAQGTKTEINLLRFFGSCDAKVGKSTDVAAAVGECGIITTLVNEFNATNKDGIVVKVQVAEWGPYYDQLTARLVAKDVPAVAVMHESVLGDFVRRKLVEPLDADFREAGIDPADFTEHARRGVIFEGKPYALPYDTWSWLWHFNMNLMKKAGLVQANGAPVVPRSPEELFEQARKFKQATGKPYFAWAAANEMPANSRTFITLVAQQGGKLFGDDGRSINMQTPEVRKALELMQKLYSEGHIKPNLDYAAANQAYLNGEAGVVVVGTWTLDQFMSEAKDAKSPLAGGYWVQPFPQLFSKPAQFADGHSWVMLKGGAKDAKTRQAALKLMRFLWDRNADWARTGHLPAHAKVAASAEFRRLPFREGLSEITRTGIGMPANVRTQRAVEIIIGEDISNMLVSKKPVAEVIDNIDKRVNAALKRAPR